jgi:hypothetical protein
MRVIDVTEEQLYQGTNETAILEVLDVVVQKAFGELLSEQPVHELVPAELRLDEIVDIGDGYKSSGRSPMMAMVSLASTMHARSKKGKGVWSTWILTTLRLHDNPSDVKILFQGGFVKDGTFAFNAISMGTVQDILVPRGYITTRKHGSAVFESALIDGDVDKKTSPSPFISVYETQSKYKESKMNKLIEKIPSYSFVEASGRFSGTKYMSETEPALVVSPRHGKTIFSVKLNLYVANGKSECATFMMPGEQKPWTLEVSVPAPANLKQGYDILKEAIDIPNHLASNVEVTGEIGGGVDTFLALETARQRYKPDSSPFSLEDVVRSTPIVSEIVNELKTNYPGIELDVASQLKGEVLKKT